MIPPRSALVALALVGVTSVACGAMDATHAEDAAAPASAEIPDRFVELEEAPNPGGGEGARARKRSSSSGKKAKEESKMAFGGAAPSPSAPPPPPAVADKDDAADDAPEESSEGAATRAWFPETFLFQPEVRTDASGTATVATRVPDRLTTWRVLALAHDRTGHQAGDVTTFTSSLPLYADPVVPAKLRVGDRVQLAVPVVNTTATPQQVQVAVSAEGLAARGGGSMSVPGLGSAVARAELVATTPGLARLRAVVRAAGSDADAVEHDVPVIPTGQRHTRSTTGTLGAPRTVSLALPSGADPASAEARLTLVPGGLGIVQSELAQAQGRARGPMGAALLLELAATAPLLWEQAGLASAPSGEDPDAAQRHEQVRTLRLIGTQRALRAQASLPLGAATALTAASARHPHDPVLVRLTDRGLSSLAGHQRPDGTFGGDTSGSWTIQRMLVATAGAVDAARRAAAADPELVEARSRVLRPIELRSEGAAERYSGRVTDAYTASALLAAGLVEGETQTRLADLVRAALVESDHGLRVDLPRGVLRADGQVPSPAAAAALAARALAAGGAADDDAAIADLGSTVLSSFRPGSGWGDAATDLACLRAVTELWSTPPAEAVTLRLSRGGAVAAERMLSVDALRNPVFLAVPAAGTGDWTVATEPPVPGLAFGLEVVAWTPWTDPPRDAGIDVAVTPPPRLLLGQTTPLVVELGSHRGTRLDVDIELPAGVKVDTDAIVVEGGPRVDDALSRDGAVSVSLSALTTNRAALHLPVTPTLAGTLWSGSISVVDRKTGVRTVVPPTAWQVGGS